MVGKINTIDELNEWAHHRDMDGSELVQSRRVEILSDLACNSVFTQEPSQPQT